MTATKKAYKGMAMEGPIATWYAKNTGRDRDRFTVMARIVSEQAKPGGDVLEVAPGPGYLATILAKRGYQVSAVDVSQSFVRIVKENAEKAGVKIDVRQGDAAAMPFADNSFDFVVCSAAFKNFSNPVGALNEMHRVLRPGGQASIFDLRKDASLREINEEVDDMNLSAWNRFATRLIFRFGLLKRAYTKDDVERMAKTSRFASGEVLAVGIGFELRLQKT